MTLIVENASEVMIPEPDGTGVVRNKAFAVVIRDGTVTWLGPQDQIPESEKIGDVEIHDAAGGAVLPALVDCHTHLVFAGDRVEDFALRAQGVSYAEIAAKGGGILTTVTATREATEDQLADNTRKRLNARKKYGIGTTEVKSGYGLSVQSELRMLRAAKRLADEGWDLELTCLAAHTVPKDNDRATYIAQIIDEILPTVKTEQLARFVDVFVEKGAYTVEEARRIFEAAKSHGLIPRIHADQLTAGGGARLAAEVGAASADHLENTPDADMVAMKDAGVVGVLLPGAAVFLGDACAGIGRRLIDAGVEVAVATDANPGSSPMMNLPLAGTFATSLMGLTAEESLRAMTLGAARALRRPDVGTLTPGSKGRFVVLNHADARALIYAFGEPVIRSSVLM